MKKRVSVICLSELIFKQIKICFSIFLLVLICFGITKNADAILLFHEDFNNGFVVDGVPTEANGADKNWYGARFDTVNDDDIQDDIKMRKNGTTDIHLRFAQFQDDAGILFPLSTLLYTDVVLDFEWRTKDAETFDKLRVGYFTGNIDFGGNIVKILTGSEGWSNWTKPFPSGLHDNNNWRSDSFDLLPGVANLWFGFWMNGDADNDKGWVDNINVNGLLIPEPEPGPTPAPSPVPEPASLLLLGTGLLMGVFGKKYLRKN